MSPSAPSSDFPFVFGAYASHLSQDAATVELPRAVEAPAPTAAPEALTRLTLSAVRTVPHAEGACLTTVEPDRPPVIVASELWADQFGRLEHSLAEGPSQAAARSARTERANALDSDDRWPRLAERAGMLKVFSAVAVPLVATDGMVGVLTLYARHGESFDSADLAMLEAIAEPTAVAVQTYCALRRTEERAAELQTAVLGRHIVERAIGIMMSRNGGSEERATALLHHMCEREQHEPAVMAREIVDEALSDAITRYKRTRLQPTTRLRSA